MNKVVLFITMFLCVLTSYAQENEVSTTTSVEHYKLFATQNMWTFLKLDTRNGRLWQVQFTTKEEPGYRYQSVLSSIKRVFEIEECNDRFTLYPTQNIYTFIMVDQVDGRCWQVQWGKVGERMVIPIEED